MLLTLPEGAASVGDVLIDGDEAFLVISPEVARDRIVLSAHLNFARGTGAERWLRESDYLYVYRDRAAFEADRFAWSLRRAAGFRGPFFSERPVADL